MTVDYQTLGNLATVISALTTVVLTVITGIYVALTNKIAKSSQQQAEAQHAALAVQNKALALQNDLLRSQVAYQRLEMYWKTFAPITPDEIKTARLVPEDWMHPDLYAKDYSGSDTDDALARYMYLARIYEYLAITYNVSETIASDPVRFHSIARWTQELAAQKAFQDVDAYYGAFYPEYSKLVKANLPAALS
jgi:hypothetical protein